LDREALTRPHRPPTGKQQTLRGISRSIRAIDARQRQLSCRTDDADACDDEQDQSQPVEGSVTSLSGLATEMATPLDNGLVYIRSCWPFTVTVSRAGSRPPATMWWLRSWWERTVYLAPSTRWSYRVVLQHCQGRNIGQAEESLPTLSEPLLCARNKRVVGQRVAVLPTTASDFPIWSCVTASGLWSDLSSSL